MTAGCGCVGFYHLESCTTLQEPMRRYAQAELEAWSAYAAATGGPRAAYARALKTKKPVYHQEFKRNQAALGGKMSLYEMVMRMDDLVGPPMKAYTEAVQPERAAWAAATKAAASAYREAVKGPRAAFLESLVNKNAGVEPPEDLVRLTGGELAHAALLPDWLPAQLRPKDRPTRVEKDDRMLMVWVPRSLALLTLGVLALVLSSDASSPDRWALGGFLGGAAITIGLNSERPSRILLAGPTLMAAGGILGLLAGGSLSASALCLAGAATFFALELGFGRMMRGFPKKKGRGRA